MVTQHKAAAHTCRVHSQEGNKESRTLELFGPFLFGLGPSSQVGVAYILGLSLLSYTSVETLSEAQKCVLNNSKSNTELIITIISSKVSKVTILSYEKQTEQKYNTHTPKA